MNVNTGGAETELHVREDGGQDINPPVEHLMMKMKSVFRVKSIKTFLQTFYKSKNKMFSFVCFPVRFPLIVNFIFKLTFKFCSLIRVLSILFFYSCQSFLLHCLFRFYFVAAKLGLLHLPV